MPACADSEELRRLVISSVFLQCPAQVRKRTEVGSGDSLLNVCSTNSGFSLASESRVRRRDFVEKREVQRGFFCCFFFSKKGLGFFCFVVVFSWVFFFAFVAIAHRVAYDQRDFLILHVSS